MKKLMNSKEVKLLLLTFEGKEQQVDLNEYLSIDFSSPYVELYTATEIGENLSIQLSARKVNEALVKYGYQYKDAKGKWKPTEKAFELIRTMPYTRQIGEMLSIDYTYKWKIDIIDILNEQMKQEEELRGVS